MREHYAQFPELAIIHIAFGILLSTLLFRTHYQDLPDEIIKAARLDANLPRFVPPAVPTIPCDLDTLVFISLKDCIE